MNCFIFCREQSAFPVICGISPLEDLIIHLRNSGVTGIYTDHEAGIDGVTVCSFETAGPELGSEWLAAYSGCITRQSPTTLRDKTRTLGADIGISLACSAKPWENTTVLTDGNGFVEKTELNPSPENSETNLCFSSLVWVATYDFNPSNPLDHSRMAAFMLPGNWERPISRENYLLTCHYILSGELSPWPHLTIPETGAVINSRIPDDAAIRGTLWVGNNCEIGSGCTLENCVILDGAVVGENSNLRNCLVITGAVIPCNTVQYDKYLSLLGDDNGCKDREVPGRSKQACS